MSSGVKSRQIRDLKMELEFRDERIHELEAAYEELERKAEFARGEVETKMADQQHDLEEMNKKQEALQAVIQAQSQQLSEVNATLEQYKSMQSMMAALMSRCKELEDAQRAQEEAQRQARLEKERAAAAAAELAAEEVRMKKEEEERRVAIAAAANERQHQVVAASRPSTAPGASTRPSNMARFRPGNAAAGGQSGRQCSIM